MNHENALRRWVIAQSEPLIDPGERWSIEYQMQHLSEQETAVFKTFVAGFLTDLVLSLDEEDPWRNLRVDESGRVLNTAGKPFGTADDAKDVLYQSSDDLLSDTGFAALANPLPSACAQVIAAAAQGWEQARSELDALEMTGFPLGGVLPAIRWVIHRRRIFAGEDDPYVILSGDAWAKAAGGAERGGPIDFQYLLRLRENSAIESGLWAEFRRPEWPQDTTS